MNEYDLAAAFKSIEDELISSMIRNMKRHKVEEARENKQWTMWQVEQLKSLERYKQQNRKKYSAQFQEMSREIENLIRQAKSTGSMTQELRILQAIRRGYKGIGRNRSKVSTSVTAEFFKLNERKLNALIEATVHDMEKAETAVLRMVNDQYRKTIFNAQVYANTGAGTYEKAVDMATKDMLSRGLNCVEYANGARHTLSDYADMAIRTASKRAYLQGEGEKRQEWGIATVIMAKRGNPCPKCLPFVGKVLIDDVWSGGKASDGPYPLMSTAIAAGLYHPRCKDSHSTYFPGISTADDAWTEKELAAIDQQSKEDARQQYAARQAERFRRLSEYSLDADNRKIYENKAKIWNGENKLLTLKEEGAVVRYISPDSYSLNDKLRRGEVLTEFEKEWIMNLDAALDKLPNYSGNLNRSLTFDYVEDAKAFADSLNIGSEVRFPQYISTKKNGLYNQEGQIQIFIQNSKSGKNLIGLNDMENEVLYPKDFPFRVLNKVKKNDTYYILLEEVH